MRVRFARIPLGGRWHFDQKYFIRGKANEMISILQQFRWFSIGLWWDLDVPMMLKWGRRFPFTEVPQVKFVVCQRSRFTINNVAE